MSEPAWQELLRLRLADRNSRESSFSPIIEQYRRLAQQTKLLKERNASLLRAVATVKQNPSSSTVFVPGTNEECAQINIFVLPLRLCTPYRNPVRQAYITSLESQISSLRDELATVYKTQGQNAQRLLAMNETLREKEEVARIESEALRKAREDISHLKGKHVDMLATSHASLQVLHDEISTLQLELGQIEERNQNLTRDNAKLLQRWLDAKQTEVNRMNEANDFYEDMRTRHQATANSQDTSDAASSPGDHTDSQRTSGNGSVNGEEAGAGTKDGTRYQQEKGVNLTPNG
ncbi:ATG16-domain-containing protein [Lactifluus volemus]|nr:ATG16-domain-containing protein [Lactifluus volemus]